MDRRVDESAGTAPSSPRWLSLAAGMIIAHQIQSAIAEPEERLETPFSVFLREIPGRTGISSMVDLGPPLRRRALEEWKRGRLLWWRDDTHMNELGHEEAARVLAESIAR